MDLFDLYAKISVDTGDFESGVNRASRSFSDLESDASRAESSIDGLGSAFKSAEGSFSGASSRIDDTADSARSAGDSFDDLSDGADQAAEASNRVNDGFTMTKGVLANLVASGIQTAISAFGNLVSAIWNLDESTEEYRVAQGKLNTAFETAGMSADTAQQSYRAFYGILGDTDTATEASQLLAKLALNEQDVATWTDIAAGVFGTFGDSLPIEGLIEASNETAKVGQVTGVLADALNWAGISEDEFNAKLASCTTESERNQLIMDTLSGTYDEASDAFYRNNEALVASRDAQAQVQDAMGQIGEAVSEVKTALLEQFAPALAEMAPKIAEFIRGINVDALVQGIGDFVGFFVNNGSTVISIIAGIGTAFATWKVTSVISTIATSLTTLLVPALTGATTAQTGLNTAMKLNPIGAIISLVAALVTGIITLWNTNEGFRNAVQTIWEAIKGFFVGAWEAIKAVWSTVADFFAGVWEGISNAFATVRDFFSQKFQQARDATERAWDGIQGFFSTLWSGIQNVFSTVRNFFSEKFQQARKASESAWDGITSFFSGVWNNIKNVFSNALNVFGEIGRNIVNGIKNGISNGWSTLTGWVKQKARSLLDAAKSALGINSPSKLFRDIVGTAIPEGVAVGIGQGMPYAYKAIDDMADNLVSSAQSRLGDMSAPISFATGNVEYSNSGLNKASSGMARNVARTLRDGGRDIVITVQSVLDGKVIGETAYRYSKNKARAYGV